MEQHTSNGLGQRVISRVNGWFFRHGSALSEKLSFLHHFTSRAQSQSKASLPPTPLLPAAIGATFGILIEDSIHLSLPLLLCLLVPVCALSFRRPNRWSFAVWATLTFSLLHHISDTLSPNRPPSALLTSEFPVALTLQGRVKKTPEESSFPGKFKHCRIHLLLESPSEPPFLKANSTVLVNWTGPPPNAGDTVRIRAALRQIPPPRNPGEFDKATFLRRQKLWMEASVHDPLDTSILSHHPGFSLETFASECSEAISRQLRRGIEDRPQTHALISSMVLGIHGDGLMEAKPAFRDTGTLHLFAVSGLNLSMLAGFLSTILKLARINISTSAWFILPTLAVYGLATGLGPSCVRALIMSMLLLSAFWIKRPAVAINSLAAAALLLFAYDSNTLFNVGFQLSFWLVLALALAAQPLTLFFEKAAQPDTLLPRRLWNTFQERCVSYWRPFASAGAVTSVAWLAGLPWNITLFHQLTPVALLANLVAVPMAFVNLTLGFLAVLAAPIGPLTPCLNRLNATCAETLFSFVQWASRIPGGRFPIASPFYKTPDFIAFDLQGGGAVMLRANQQVCLLDCGSETQARSIIVPGLQSFGIVNINMLLLSHGNSQYIGGALSILETLNPTLIFESPLKDKSRTRRQFRKWLELIPKPIHTISVSDSLPLGQNTQIDILYPPLEMKSTIADNKCIVVRWKTPTFTLLYTASAGFPTERWLLEHRQSELAADIWIRGWHSRELTGTDDFVRAIRPRVIIVAGQRNPRDPEESAAWITRWRQEGIHVFSQQHSGAVLGISSPGGLEIQSLLGKERVHWRPP